ncbi:MAG: hypothetical protein Q4A64_00235 [Porphyromonadaceae bacterium]|nr:hypothetical protein [Porphyromonadaceae bacterium]
MQALTPSLIPLLCLIILLSACSKATNEPQGSTPLAPIVRPKLPIEYMAERNVDQSGHGFVESDRWQDCGYFTYEEASRIDIAGYHLPSPEEMNGILPIPHREQHMTNPNGYPKTYMGIPKDFNAAPPILISDDQELMEVAGERGLYSSLYGVVGAYTGRRAAYALRFWDERERKYYSAFRYEIQRTQAGTRLDESLTQYRLQIRVRYLGKHSSLRLTPQDMELVCSEDWWAKGGERDIVAYLPNCGFIFDPSSPERHPSVLGTIGRYWLKESESPELKRYRYLEISNKATGMDGHEVFPRLPVRLFRNHN